MFHARAFGPSARKKSYKTRRQTQKLRSEQDRMAPQQNVFTRRAAAHRLHRWRGIAISPREKKSRPIAKAVRRTTTGAATARKKCRCPPSRTIRLRRHAAIPRFAVVRHRNRRLAKITVRAPLARCRRYRRRWLARIGTATPLARRRWNRRRRLATIVVRTPGAASIPPRLALAAGRVGHGCPGSAEPPGTQRQ